MKFKFCFISVHVNLKQDLYYMNLLVIGSGGREHAICYKLRQSKRINELFCLPGNAGTKKLQKILIKIFQILRKFIKS